MFRLNKSLARIVACCFAVWTSQGFCQDGNVAGPSDTMPLTIEGDLASQMVDGIDRFLLKQIETDAASRAEKTSTPIRAR